MTDHYVWIDPFEEVEKAQRSVQYANNRAEQARTQGRNDVLDYEYRNPGLLQRAIEDQAYRIAERVIEDQIKPTFADAMRRKRVRDASLEILSFTPLNLILPRIESERFSPPFYDDRPDFTVITEVHMKAFKYAVAERLA